MNVYELAGQVPITEVLTAEGIAWTKRGRTLWTICPFHKDRKPSLAIYPEQNRFYCFSCGVSGDVTNIYARLHGLSNRAAALALVEKYHLKDARRPDPTRRTDPPAPWDAADRQAAAQHRMDLAQAALDRIIADWRTDRLAVLREELREAEQEAKELQRLYRTSVEAAANPQWDEIAERMSRLLLEEGQLIAMQPIELASLILCGGRAQEGGGQEAG